MSAPSTSTSHTSSHTFTSEGFRKLPLIGENGQKQKVRLYYLNLQREKVEAAKAALERKLSSGGWSYNLSLSTFKEDIQSAPYLLKEGRSLTLLSTKQAIELQLKYGVLGAKAEKKSTNILNILDEHQIKTDEQLVAFYNHSNQDIRDELLPLINVLFFIFSKERTVLKPEEIKTITLLAKCQNERIQNGALNLLIDLFESSRFKVADYGYALKYLLDSLPQEFFKKNQLLLLNVFDKLSAQLDCLLHTGKSVNHEIDPLTSPLISVGRALVNSDLEGLNKATKNEIYQRLKTFYNDEHYSKRIEALSLNTNYFLIHPCLWTIQHLVRISSSESKVVTAFRKTCHGLLTIKILAGTPFKAASDLLHGEIPDETLVEELKKAYQHGKKAFGIKDIPRPWYDMLEQTEQILINPKLTVVNLEKLSDLIDHYEEFVGSFNTLIKKRFSKLSQETKEFTFGFVVQLSDVAMDHPQMAVRHKAIELLEKIFHKNDQYHDVKLMIFTILQNIIDQTNDEITQQAKLLQSKLYLANLEFKKTETFRQSKYPCLSLIQESSSLLDAAREKFESVSSGIQSLPMSEFIYGSKDIKVFKETVRVGGNFAPKAPEPISSEELERVIKTAERLHIIALDRNPNTSTKTKLGNRKETTFEKEVIITGDFVG